MYLDWCMSYRTYEFDYRICYIQKTISIGILLCGNLRDTTVMPDLYFKQNVFLTRKDIFATVYMIPVEY